MFKALNVMSSEQIFKECEKVQAFLEAPYSSDDARICVERATDLEIHLAFSAKLVADAEYNLNAALKSSIMEGIKQMGEEAMGVTLLRQYIVGVTKDLQYLVKWTDRLNRTITHDLDLARSIISMHKNESTRFQT